MFVLANERYPSLETALASILANAEAASNSDYSCLIPMLMGYIESAHRIQMHLKWSPLCQRRLKLDSTCQQDLIITSTKEDKQYSARRSLVSYSTCKSLFTTHLDDFI
uniref:Uncharacterized protein n=1 Tax=Romanomermis culicivorax TaxID=13658 RepID=A0A915JMY6_ROMCU